MPVATKRGIERGSGSDPWGAGRRRGLQLTRWWCSEPTSMRSSALAGTWCRSAGSSHVGHEPVGHGVLGLVDGARRRRLPLDVDLDAHSAGAPHRAGDARPRGDAATPGRAAACRQRPRRKLEPDRRRRMGQDRVGPPRRRDRCAGPARPGRRRSHRRARTTVGRPQEERAAVLRTRQDRAAPPPPRRPGGVDPAGSGLRRGAGADTVDLLRRRWGPPVDPRQGLRA